MKPACRLSGSTAFTECDSRFHFCIKSDPLKKNNESKDCFATVVLFCIGSITVKFC